MITFIHVKSTSNTGDRVSTPALYFPWPDPHATIDFRAVGGAGFDPVICGGESGPNARPMDLAWARSVRDQCRTAGVPFFMKQLSEADFPKTFKSFDAFPEDLQIREMPR